MTTRLWFALPLAFVFCGCGARQALGHAPMHDDLAVCLAELLFEASVVSIEPMREGCPTSACWSATLNTHRVIQIDCWSDVDGGDRCGEHVSHPIVVRRVGSRCEVLEPSETPFRRG